MSISFNCVLKGLELTALPWSKRVDTVEFEYETGVFNWAVLDFLEPESDFRVTASARISVRDGEDGFDETQGKREIIR